MKPQERSAHNPQIERREIAGEIGAQPPNREKYRRRRKEWRRKEARLLGGQEERSQVEARLLGGARRRLLGLVVFVLGIAGGRFVFAGVEFVGEGFGRNFVFDFVFVFGGFRFKLTGLFFAISNSIY